MRAAFALADDHVSLSPAELDRLVGRAAAALAASGAARVGVMGENCAETLVCHLAALRAGVAGVPVPRYLTPAEAAYILSDSGASLVMAGPQTAETARKAAAEAGLDTVVAWRSERGTITFDEWLAVSGSAPAPDGARPAATLLMYTSGTTGRPKATEARWLRRLPATVAEHLAAIAEQAPFPPGPHLVAGPLHHTGPLGSLRHLVAGQPVVVASRFEPERTLELIERHRVASSVMVPTHFSRLLALPAAVRARYDVSSLQRVIHTGAACPPEVKRAMIAWWGPVLVEAYGGSESGTVCSISSEEWLARPGSVGRPVPGFEALILGPDGEVVPPGTEGALWFRDHSGRGVRYLGAAAPRHEPGRDPGLFTLGEVGRIDDDGYVYITDRTSDMVVSGGVNLYPAESEAVLIAHPAVADVAVIGVPHPDLGEALHALVVAANGAGAPGTDELDAWCRAKLSAPKCPRSYEIVGSLNRNAMGKLDKRALRRPYWPTGRTIGG